MLAHAAFRMGEALLKNALKGNHHVAKLNLTPAAIYTPARSSSSWFDRRASS